MAVYRTNISNLLGIGGQFLVYAFFRGDETESGNGVVEADLKAFTPPLKLVHRTDSTERGIRRAVWMQFES